MIEYVKAEVAPGFIITLQYFVSSMCQRESTESQTVKTNFKM